MKPHRDDYARAFAERHGFNWWADTVAYWIIAVLVAALALQVILAIVGWPASERVFPCEPGAIYAEPRRVYECTPQGTWRLRGAK